MLALGHVDGTQKRDIEVKGLLDIFVNYKFTVDENTPVEEEVALDPELLGKVFENLLASYNKDTKTTARKQSGSFYTPRVVVDYMVDESLKAHLVSVLVEKASMSEADARAKQQTEGWSVVEDAGRGWRKVRPAGLELEARPHQACDRVRPPGFPQPWPEVSIGQLALDRVHLCLVERQVVIFDDEK